ncbi:6-bladed beta-propeller [Paraglaciecola sp.]|uniref:6-bladed beta-propeller n=1 Tax=Paraglaciecola sp. TaxID=1920173 RepID=UPI003EF7F84C
MSQDTSSIKHNEAGVDDSKRQFIKNSSAISSALLLSAFSQHSSAHEPPKKPLPKASREAAHGKIIGHGDFKYKVNYFWGNLDPHKVPVENCHGLAFDSQGRIVMVTDSDKNNFVIYNKDGKLLDAWGTQHPGAHSVKINHENGEDFIYIVDCGWVLNRNWDGVTTGNWKSPKNKFIPQQGFISKLTLDGKLVYTIGHPLTIGIYNANDPFRPTDITIAANGDLYVTDGYGSDRVIQYNHNGQYIRHWGGKNNQDSNYNLSNTHGIGIDLRNPADPHLVVSSRAANELKLFEMDGKYRSTVQTPGAFVGGPIFKGEYAYIPVCWSVVDGKRKSNSGFITILDKNNKVVSNPGGTQPIYQEGKLQNMHTTWDVFNHCHAVCVDNDENLYVGQWNSNQTYPIKLERV